MHNNFYVHVRIRKEKVHGSKIEFSPIQKCTSIVKPVLSDMHRETFFQNRQGVGLNSAKTPP